MITGKGLLLVDTDLLILLTASATLEQVTGWLGYESSQLRRLPAALPQIRRGKRFRDTYGEALLKQIEPIVAGIAEIDAPTNLDLLDTLNDIVDAGEAQLMAIAMSEPCTLLISGDKRAIRGLAESGATDCIVRLNEKIVVLETILRMLVQTNGAAAVRKAFTPVLGYRTLGAVLSEHAVADQQRCLQAIEHYFDELRSKVTTLLYSPAAARTGSMSAAAQRAPSNTSISPT